MTTQEICQRCGHVRVFVNGQCMGCGGGSQQSPIRHMDNQPLVKKAA